MNSLVARCPHCDTAFKVVPEQLRVRQGRVRCGVCHEIFDGNAALVRAGHKPVTLRTTDPVAAAPVVSPLASEAPDLPATPEPQPVKRGVWGDADTARTARSANSFTPGRAVSGPASATRRAEPHLADSSAVEPRQLEPWQAEPRQVEPRQVEPRQAAPRQIEPRQLEPRFVESRPVEPRPVRSGEFGREPSFSAREPVDEPHWPGPAAFAASRPDAAAVPPMLAPAPVFSFSRLLFMLGFWLALLALIAQALWWWRTPLATHIPVLRERLEQVCQVLGCEVGYVRAPQRLSIASSAVQPAVLGGSADVQHLQLQAVLRNRAPHDQPWPHLEIVLTDHSDGTVARRVVAPDEYLPDGLWRQPFPAGSDRPINLALAARGNPVSGYRLALFFP